MKDEREGKIIIKFAATTRKTYGYIAQKDGHEIKDSEFIKEKGVRKSEFKELTFHDFDNVVTI